HRLRDALDGHGVRRPLGGGAARAELAAVVVAPAPDLATAVDGAGVGVAAGDVAGVAEADDGRHLVAPEAFHAAIATNGAPAAMAGREGLERLAREDRERRRLRHGRAPRQAALGVDAAPAAGPPVVAEGAGERRADAERAHLRDPERG